MAATHASRPAPFGAISIFRLMQGLGSIGESFAAWNDARVTRNALSRLTDRELDDIGLTRADIDTIATN